MHDREFQSAIHERKHHFDGAPEMTVDEQIAFVQGLRQQIENSPSISDREKYRVSHDQPGLITRLDDELQRLKTGTITDRHGQTRPLLEKNRNSGADLQSIQYLGTLVPRMETAKAQYFEINARHTGRSVDDVRAEWNSIMAREGDGRGNVGISLRDDWRDQLAVAGVTSQTQADIGQSARARDALKEMETRRQAVLAAQPQRPTIRPEHRRRYTSPTGQQMRCDNCGQFGHEHADCQNADLVARRDLLADQHRVATNHLKAAMIQRHLDDDVEDDDVAIRLLEIERDAFADGAPIGTVASADAELKRIANQDSEIQSELDSRAPKVSTWIQEVAYNEESGLMTVTTQPRQRKDGQTSPAVTYPYRVSKDEAARILEHPDVGVAVNQSVMRRGKERTNDAFHWENAADAEAAMAQHKCPTCGKFASMTSSHTCRLKGEEEADTNDRAALAQWRKNSRAAKDAGLEPPDKPMPRVPVPADRYRKMADGGVAHVPNRDTVINLTSGGKVAAAAISIKHPDATVSGQTTVWQDPDGRRLVSPLKAAGGEGLRCTCEQYSRNGNCPHIKAATVAVAQHWGANPIGHPDVRPGVSLAEVHRNRTSDTAFDAPKRELERLDYGRIRKFRREKIGTHLEGLCEKQRRGEPINGPRVRPPRDAEGNTVAWPDTFQRPGGNHSHAGAPVDLNDTSDVQYRIRAGLYARTRKHFSVTRDPDGGMRITVPKSRRSKGGDIPLAERRELCDALGIPATSSRADGVYVPADTSWRHEYLSRAYGDPPAVHASKFTVA